MTIYTIGYQRLRPERLEAILRHLDASLIDVRSSPQSRNPSYRRKALEARYGDGYIWMGDTLGGMNQDFKPAAMSDL
jgi:uncharacterized protein (DUF488 family)